MLMNKHLLLILLTFGSFGVVGDDEFSAELIKEAASCIEKGFLTPFGLDDCFEGNERLKNIKLSRKDAEVLHQEGARYRYEIAQEERQLNKEKQFKAFVDRCISYGFSGESNIAACVQREVQHDLELAQQEQRLQQLENRIASASKPSNDKPFFLEVLSILAEEAERQDELAQRVRLYELESEVSSLRSSMNVKKATCSLNRNC